MAATSSKLFESALMNVQLPSRIRKDEGIELHEALVRSIAKIHSLFLLHSKEMHVFQVFWMQNYGSFGLNKVLLPTGVRESLP